MNPSHEYEVRPRKDHRGVDLISDVLPFGRLTAFSPNFNESHAMTVIEIKPHRNGWKVFGAPGVERVFPEKRQAINYAQNRASFRSGEIRILGSNGIVGRTISLDQLGGRSFKGKIPRGPGVE